MDQKIGISYNTQELKNSKSLFGKHKRKIIIVAITIIILIIVVFLGGYVQKIRANSYISYAKDNYTFGNALNDTNQSYSYCYKPGRKEPWSIDKYCIVTASFEYEINNDTSQNNQSLVNVYNKMQKDGLKRRYAQNFWDSRALEDYNKISFSSEEERTVSGSKELIFGPKCNTIISYNSLTLRMELSIECWFSADYFII